MPEINKKESIFSPDVDMSIYTVPPLEPIPKDTRGFVYVVACRNFPDYVKIGQTKNMVKRLSAYNQDRPLKTVEALYVSSMFQDAPLVEKRILEHMYKSHGTGGNTSEWFASVYKNELIDLIQEAEDYFHSNSK